MSTERTEGFLRHTLRINKFPQRKEEIKAARIEVDLFRKRYKMFKNGEVEEIDLVALDLKHPSNASSVDTSSVEMKYEDLYKRFLDTFSHDIEDQSSGILREKPEPKTKHLIQHILLKPFSDVDFRFTSYLLKTQFPYQNAIVIKRYFLGNPLRVSAIEPIAEVWSATRFRYDTVL